ncbi:hypothetical protein [Komagataeibacter swingsii]|uniref:Uncharacterized protein n=1 Tax=Komagataeibacter swingsii TaxID=215220 RepID=A0A2V4QV65_9PROT|nr:hypothetical protein [Komagataeibacter swingsii]PYD68421.1 hypothetical protein CFR76_15200 [Komagataeibacter swingsii]
MQPLSLPWRDGAGTIFPSPIGRKGRMQSPAGTGYAMVSVGFCQWTFKNSLLVKAIKVPEAVFFLKRRYSFEAFAKSFTKNCF